ncbi:MAG: hypothetical protein JWO63_2800 [Frankiales bacterium]|nr:hypothetical protein [Frankiales bacterium]
MLSKDWWTQLRAGRPSAGAGVHPALLTMAAVLLSFGSALLLETPAHLHSDVAILAVVLALTLSRTASAAGWRELGRRALTLPIVAILAGRVGNLMIEHVALGDALFVLALSGAVWLRRFGPVASRVGSLISLPFIGILVVPVPVSEATAHSLWPAVIALIALSWVTLVTWLGHRLGWLPEPGAASTLIRRPTPPRARGPEPDGARPTSRRVPASTKMAAQLGVALGLSFLVGHRLYPQHWPWVVLTCYLVCSGNRGRGDVLHKSVLRLAGAGAGTAVATLLAARFAAGDRTAVVLIFVVLALAVWLRARSYGFWAAGVTAVLALLNGFYGISGSNELVQRLGGVSIGALIGVSVSWWLLPVRSGDVFRSRAAGALAALSAHLAALRTDPAAAPATAEAFGHRVEELRQLLPAFALHRRTLGRSAGSDPAAPSHVVDVIAALSDVRSALSPPRMALAPASPAAGKTLGALASQVGLIRRRMSPSLDPSTAARAVSSPPVASPEPALAAAALAIHRLDGVFTNELWRQHGG